jgi:hypothetical protein
MTSADTRGVVSDGMPARLSMVVLSARDLPSLRRFYQALGWPERSGASDALAMFDLGATVLTLHPAAESTGDPSGAERADTVSSVTLVVHVDARDGVDDAVTAALAAGAGLVAEPVDQSWGGRSAVVADPEGNRWEVLWVPRPPA